MARRIRTPFFKVNVRRRIKMQDKLQKLCNMQEICRTVQAAEQNGNVAETGVKNKQGRNGLGKG